MVEILNPEYPIYIVSKGRWETRLTSRAMERMGVPYRIVVEPQERDQYAAVIDPAKILVLPFSNLGQGSIPARNWIWEHATVEGYARHWILDDNIRNFRRYHHNKRPISQDGEPFRVLETFVERYENVALAGFQYTMFAITGLTLRCPPFLLNTRIYSCILIKNDLPYRWRGRYNEDTDLSLRVLKDGWCTILLLAYLADKQQTMSMKGGNTDSLYLLPDGRDGRLLMAQSLQQQHPDVVKITRKWGRWQHQVDYRPFKTNRLIRKPGLVLPEGTNEYGMRLVRREPGTPLLERPGTLVARP